MAIPTPTSYPLERLLSRIVSMYYLENLNQLEISRALGLSTAKVNRLIQQARRLGMVEIRLNVPYQKIITLERQIEKIFQVKEAVVVPEYSPNEETVLQSIGQAAAMYLLDQVQDGDIICLGGGRALLETIKALRPQRSYDIRVVPAIGGVQGRHYTDVNNLAAELANRLGGRAYQLHAPAFVDTQAEQRAILSLRQVQDVLDMARHARISLIGVGSLIPETASYFQFTSLSLDQVAQMAIHQEGTGEILARVFNRQGQYVAKEYSNRVVGLSLEELKSIPMVIGIAGMSHKAPAIAGALSGGLLKVIITDEATGIKVLANARNESIK